VRAINEGGCIGDPAVIKYARTRMANYKYRLEKGGMMMMDRVDVMVI
jgi:hypothetical protein